MWWMLVSVIVGCGNKAPPATSAEPAASAEAPAAEPPAASAEAPAELPGVDLTAGGGHFEQRDGQTVAVFPVVLNAPDDAALHWTRLVFRGVDMKTREAACAIVLDVGVDVPAGGVHEVQVPLACIDVRVGNGMQVAGTATYTHEGTTYERNLFGFLSLL